MIKKELNFKEMIDFVNHVSANEAHDTYINVLNGSKVVREISCTSRLRMIHGFRSIRFKSHKGNKHVSFVKSKIIGILFVVYDLNLKLAYLKISDKRKTALIMININVLEECPL